LRQKGPNPDPYLRLTDPAPEPGGPKTSATLVNEKITEFRTVFFSFVRLVQYFFLDLAHLLDPEMWMDLVDNLIKFPSAFSLPPSIIKLTQVSYPVFHSLLHLLFVFSFPIPILACSAGVNLKMWFFSMWAVFFTFFVVFKKKKQILV
jgi:hypothetical protein